jgi:hypothetical protein
MDIAKRQIQHKTDISRPELISFFGSAIEYLYRNTKRSQKNNSCGMGV